MAIYSNVREETEHVSILLLRRQLTILLPYSPDRAPMNQALGEEATVLHSDDTTRTVWRHILFFSCWHRVEFFSPIKPEGGRVD